MLTDYTAAPVACPAEVSLTAIAVGRFNTLVWTQELWFRQRLLFSNESVTLLAAPRVVTADPPGRWRSMMAGERAMWQRLPGERARGAGSRVDQSTGRLDRAGDAQ
jgi:hypothetical protein